MEMWTNERQSGQRYKSTVFLGYEDGHRHKSTVFLGYVDVHSGKRPWNCISMHNTVRNIPPGLWHCSLILML